MWNILELNEHIARISKQSITTVNVMIVLFLNIPLGLLYHKLLHPKRVSHAVRHLVGLLFGLSIGWFCIKREIFILIVICMLCYILNYAIHPKQVHKVVFAASFGILLLAQIIRMIESYGENDFDYTGRLMVLVQKFTLVACSFHDGMSKDKKDLNEWQQKQRIKKFPSLLEYFGYMFHFGGFLVGPTYSYREYIDFIEGKDMERALADSKGHNREPSPLKCLISKAWMVLLTLAGIVLIAPKLPFKRNGDPVFIANTPFLLRCLYAWVSLVALRLKYHTAFLLGEMGVISSGMGFSGYDKNGNELWDNASLVNIPCVEFPSSLKMVVDNWNISTAKWLKRVVHDRVPYQKAALTFAVSLLWHGIYPGYFMIAFPSFLYLQLCKETRRAYGDVYQDLSPIGQWLLHVLQIVANIALLTFSTIPFLLLRFDLCIQFWRSMYFFGIIVCGLGLVFFRMRKRLKPKEKPIDLAQEAINDLTKKSDSHANNNAAHLRKPHFNKGS